MTLSRTDNTRPIRIQEEDGARGPFRLRWNRRFGFTSCDPGKHWGGSWRGIKQYNKEYWGRVRAAERVALGRGEEPEPARTRHSSRWELY